MSPHQEKIWMKTIWSLDSCKYSCCRTMAVWQAKTWNTSQWSEKTASKSLTEQMRSSIKKEDMNDECDEWPYLSEQAWSAVGFYSHNSELKTIFQDDVCAVSISRVMILIQLCPLRPVTVMITPRVKSSNRRKAKLHRAPSVVMRPRRPKTSACPVSIVFFIFLTCGKLQQPWVPCWIMIFKLKHSVKTGTLLRNFYFL